MNIWKFVISVALPLIVGSLSGYLTSGDIKRWFTTIEKPSFNPPDAVFAPVWTILYILMGIAFYLVWTKNTSSVVKRGAMTLYFIQLVLNFFWSIIFFGAHEIGWALVEIVTLWIFILLTIVSFRKISVRAALLLLPYILWVTFAAALNYAIWRLN